jgi:hypothetical protein
VFFRFFTNRSTTRDVDRGHLAGRAAFALFVLASCRTPPRPWERNDAPAPAASTVEERAEPDDSGIMRPGEVSLLSEAGSLLAQDDAGVELDGPPETPVRVGGPWVRCYGHFKPSGDPTKDVTRLGLLCGPENGMRRMAERSFTGAVAEGGATVSSSLPAKRGECYRIFAVAEPSVGDLDVAVQSSRGTAVAADHGEDAWPIVQPDRPFCPFEDDTFTLVVSARRGNGRFAAEVWRLASPSPALERGASKRAD